MSDGLGLFLAVTLGDIVPAAIGVYAAYWAFSIRRALSGRIYRRHALWLGAVCVIIQVGLPLASLPSSSFVATLGINLLVLALLVFVFAFVDSIVPVARRSDPRLRGILHWEKVRFVLWGDLALAGIYLVYNAINPTFGSAGWGAVIGFPLFMLPFIVGAPVILIGAIRSKDYVLRASLEWFGGRLAVLLLSGALLSFIELIILGISAYNASFSYPALVFVPGNILGAYCLYRSARSLAPTSRLPVTHH